MNAEKRPGGRSSSAGRLDSTKSTPTTRSRCGHLVDELVSGRWPGREMPRLALEQVVALAALRHPDERGAIAAIVPAAALCDHQARLVYEAALDVDPGADDQYVAVAKRLHAVGLDRTPVDLLLSGGDLAFVVGAVWRLAVAELARRIEVDVVRDAAVSALVSLDAGADPEKVAERLAQRAAS